MPSQANRAERRMAPRNRVLERATIVSRGGRSTMPCYLVDVSESGARLAECEVPSCPNDFALHPHGSHPRYCRVVWRSTEAMGVRYVEADRTRRLHQIIARFERLLRAGVDGSNIAETYRAEIDAARAMLDELEATLQDGDAPCPTPPDSRAP